MKKEPDRAGGSRKKYEACRKEERLRLPLFSGG